MRLTKVRRLSVVLLSVPFSVFVAAGLLLTGALVRTALATSSWSLAGSLALGLSVALGGGYIGSTARRRARERAQDASCDPEHTKT